MAIDFGFRNCKLGSNFCLLMVTIINRLCVF